MGDKITSRTNTELKYISKVFSDKVLNSNYDFITKIDILRDVVRLNILYMIANAGSGHIGTSFSSVEIMLATLLTKLNPTLRENSVFFSSKGHDAPALYCILIMTGIIKEDKIHALRKIDGLPGHPDIKTPGIITNTGSLGMGISKAKGIILGNRLKKIKQDVYVLLGDGELQEGQIWESLLSASNFGLYELKVIVDYNKLQSDTYVSETSNLGDLENKFISFGFNVERCDGNNIESLQSALKNIQNVIDKPNVIIADTIKGCGVDIFEPINSKNIELYDFHSGAPDVKDYKIAVRQIIERLKSKCQKINLEFPEINNIPKNNKVETVSEKIELIKTYSKLLLEIMKKNKDLIILDADLAKDTGVYNCKSLFPNRYVECGIAEQDMVSCAGGIALKGYIPMVHSFSCFLSTRANEQIFNNGTEGNKILYFGSLSGLMPAGPGHSHQSIRDISLFNTIPNLHVIIPSSDEELEALLDWAIYNNKKQCFFRLESFPVPKIKKFQNILISPGKGNILQEGNDLTIIFHGPLMNFIASNFASFYENEKSVKIQLISHPWCNLFDSDWYKHTLSKTNKILLLDNSDGCWSSEIIVNLREKAGYKDKILRKYIIGIPSCGTYEEVTASQGLDEKNLFNLIK